MGKRKRKQKKGVGTAEPESLTKAPHSFVIKRGKLGKYVNQLMLNFRKVLEPFTAMNLKVRKGNSVKDYVSVASSLNVTHLMVFTKTAKAAYLRLTRLPRGPTLTFKIVNYTLAKDVISCLKKPLVYSGLFQFSPLLVLNSFTGDEQLQMKLMTSMWRNLFPSIDVNKVNLNTIRRCVLLNYNPDTKLIDFRHYAIKVKPVGVSRSVKKLIGKRIPDLGQYNDVHEIMSRDNAAFTESEGEADEMDESRQITLPQRIASRGNMMNEKSAIRLIELGPRMTLELMKIEEGLMTGEVLFHSLIKKTKAEVKEQKHERQQKIRLKLSRKRQQEINVRKKQKLIENRSKNQLTDDKSTEEHEHMIQNE